MKYLILVLLLSEASFGYYPIETDCYIRPRQDLVSANLANKEWWKVVRDEASTPPSTKVSRIKVNPKAFHYEGISLRMLELPEVGFQFGICHSFWQEGDTIKSYNFTPLKQAESGDKIVVKDEAEKPLIILKEKRDPVPGKLAASLKARNFKPMMLVEKLKSSERVLMDYDELYDRVSGEVKAKFRWFGDLNKDGKVDFVKNQNDISESLILSKGESYQELPSTGYVFRPPDSIGTNSDVEILFTKSYSDAEMKAYKSGEPWYAIYEEAGVFKSKKVHLEVTVEDAQEEDSQVSVDISLKEKNIQDVFLIRNIIPPKIIAYGSTFSSNSDAILFDGGGVQLIFREKKDPLSITAANPYHAEVSPKILTVKYQDKEILLLDSRALEGDETPGYNASLRFAGDLNGDGLPDFLLNIGPTYRSSVEILFMSEKAGDLFQYVPSKSFSESTIGC